MLPSYTAILQEKGKKSDVLTCSIHSMNNDAAPSDPPQLTPAQDHIHLLIAPGLPPVGHVVEACRKYPHDYRGWGVCTWVVPHL